MPPRGSQDASRTPQDGFWLRFGSPTWSHVGHFFDPRRPQKPQDASKRRPWECLGASWRRLGASWRPRPNMSDFGSLLGPSWPHFWKVFGWFLMGFWLIFIHFYGRFLVDFLILFLLIFDWFVAGFLVLYTVLVYNNVYSTAYSITVYRMAGPAESWEGSRIAST